jgi:hypothetical protein
MNQLRQVQAQLSSGKYVWLREDEGSWGHKAPAGSNGRGSRKDLDLQIFYLVLKIIVWRNLEISKACGL